MRHRGLTFIALAAAVVLSACGGGSNAGSSAGDDASGEHAGAHDEPTKVHDPVDGAEEATLTAIDIDYKPDRLSLVAGEPTNVTVANEGETTHDFTLEEADVHMPVDPGAEETTSVTIDEPGDYTAICSVPGHEDAGMVVQVSVTE